MHLPRVVATLMAVALTAAAPEPIITRVTIVGDPAVSPATLTAHLVVRPGVRYSDTVREGDAEATRDFYEARHLELGAIQGGIDPTTIDPNAGTAAVKYAIYAARIAAVHVDGARDVSQVLKLLHLRPGMLLNTELVKADEQRLRGTGKFARVNVGITPGPKPNKPQDVTLVWTLR